MEDGSSRFEINRKQKYKKNCNQTTVLFNLVPCSTKYFLWSDWAKCFRPLQLRKSISQRIFTATKQNKTTKPHVIMSFLVGLTLIKIAFLRHF